ncbi:MAG: hypothetical protein J5643_07005 [Lachnospiraceae bacterium]|nr:hypothetical protein [Lachnospiraceae bacterium]
MKKRLSLTLGLIFVMLLTGCGAGSGHGKGKGSFGVQDVLQEGLEKEQAKNNTPAAGTDPTPDAPTIKADPKWECGDVPLADMDETVDVDLSPMSREMAATMIATIWGNSEQYVGKTIRVTGEYNGVAYPDYNIRYDNVLTYVDPSGCCSYGFEFVLVDEYAFPDDYPDEGATICVVGVLDTYIDDGVEYCTLRNAKKVK